MNEPIVHHLCGREMDITDEYFSAAIFRKWNPEKERYEPDGREDQTDETSYICGHCGGCMSDEEVEWYKAHMAPELPVPAGI
jgi:hypothetical protein